MLNNFSAFVRAHVMFGGLVMALVGALSRHYLPQFKAFIVTKGTDDVVMAALSEFKRLLKSAGATDDEIQKIESLSAQVALRAAADVEQDVQQKP